jgi:hypothetical protein
MTAVTRPTVTTFVDDEDVIDLRPGRPKIAGLAAASRMTTTE